MSTFAIDTQRWAKKALLDFERLRKAVIIELFSSVVLDTPVDTGRLRGNWIITNGAPASETIQVTDPTGATTTAKIRAHATSLTGEDLSVFLANNLDYVYRIEYEGWSHTKAPEGMVRKNFIRISENLKKRYG